MRLVGGPEVPRADEIRRVFSALNPPNKWSKNPTYAIIRIPLRLVASPKVPRGAGILRVVSAVNPPNKRSINPNLYTN